MSRQTTAAAPPRENHSTQGRYSSSTGARGAAHGVTGGGRASSHSDRCTRMARTKRRSSMNETIFRTLTDTAFCSEIFRECGCQERVRLVPEDWTPGEIKASLPTFAW